jgi:hypothetical protein
MLPHFQGRGVETALQTIRQRYLASLIANWKIWTIPQILNLSLVPVHLRVLVANLVSFVWNIYLSSKAQSRITKKEL